MRNRHRATYHAKDDLLIVEVQRDCGAAMIETGPEVNRFVIDLEALEVTSHRASEADLKLVGRTPERARTIQEKVDESVKRALRRAAQI